jgi:ribA/ribD-fused uncharacterized protein
MAAGFPLMVAGCHIPTSEALYQACRFPHRPEIQRHIIDQASPMAAKMVGKPFRFETRPDWSQIRIPLMRWCLHVKLAQHWVKFGDLLAATGERPIVEESRRDAFWGAKPHDGDTLVGMNVLGRLLMELRADLTEGPASLLCRVAPLELPEFSLIGRPIGVVSAGDMPHQDTVALPRRHRASNRAGSDEQMSIEEWLLPEEDI